LILFFAACASIAAARTWHVSGSGSDTHAGTDSSTAFRSLQKAAGLVEPGDTVLIGDGVYPTPTNDANGNVLTISRSGRPDAWITWQAAPGTHPELRPTGWGGIVVTGSYHVIDGLTVVGGNDSLTLLDAQADAKNAKPGARFNTNGILVNGRLRGPAEKPHHITIRRCSIGKLPGGGIVALEADYLTVEDCQVFENGWYMRYAGSGITTLGNWRFDEAPGYHIVIQRNLVWANKTLVPWERTGKLSDGNGILLDVTDGDEDDGATNPNADTVTAAKPTAKKNAKPPRPPWHGRALIANNVSAYNGGSGIHTFRTRHVDIINNTTYWNGSVVGYQELFANRSDDIVILNNIIVPRPGGKVTSNSRNTAIRWDYNLSPVAQTIFKGAHDLVAEPRFIDVQPDLRRADFRLAPGSPGLGSATDELPQATDLLNRPRPAIPFLRALPRLSAGATGPVDHCRAAPGAVGIRVGSLRRHGQRPARDRDVRGDEPARRKLRFHRPGRRAGDHQQG
jgi:hypothetical protein